MGVKCVTYLVIIIRSQLQGDIFYALGVLLYTYRHNMIYMGSWFSYSCR